MSDYNPMDCSLQGSSVHEIFQAIVLQWFAIAFSKDEATLEQLGSHVEKMSQAL